MTPYILRDREYGRVILYTKSIWGINLGLSDFSLSVFHNSLIDEVISSDINVNQLNHIDMTMQSNNNTRILTTRWAIRNSDLRRIKDSD